MMTEENERSFRAPWGTSLWTITIGVGGGLGIGIVVSELLGVQVLLAAILIVPLVLSVRGYTVRDGQLLVHRLGWVTRFDLADLRKVEVAPGVMRGSLMTFGNGGLFGFVGHFRNNALGAYRAYATKKENAVVLRLNGGPVVVTPDEPVAFVDAVKGERETVS